MNRALSLLLSCAIVLLSPGLAAYEAAAADFNAPKGPEGAGFRLPAAPIRLGTNLDFSHAQIPTNIPTVETGIPALVPLTPDAARLDVSAALQQVSPTQPEAGTPAAEVPAKLEQLSGGVAEAIQKGDLPHADAGASRETGAHLQDILSGSHAVSVSGDAPNASFGDAGEGMSFGKPAGWDSIRPDAERYQAKLPAPPSDGDGGKPSAPAPKVPLVPRIVSAVTALLPAVFLGWPLLAGGSLVVGSLVIVASLSTAALPFMSDSTPKLARSAPGAVIGALGLGTLSTLMFGFSWPVAAMGALATLGGWGFTRFAVKGGGKGYRDANETIATFFGALAAVSGAGLVLLHPAGWLATGLTWISYAGSTVLLTQLPSWVGAAMTSAFLGGWRTFKDSLQVMGAIHRDTSLLKRLSNYTQAAVEKDAWNALWLGLLVWLPVVAVEAVRFGLGAALGALQAAGRAPLNLLWGASHELSMRGARRAWQQAYDANGGAGGNVAYEKAEAAKKAALDGAVITKFFAGWAGFAYHNSKGNLFNPLEKALLPFANSDSRWRRAVGAVALSLLQAGWSLYSIVMIPGSILAGIYAGVKNAGAPYDAKKDDPETAGPAKDETPEAPAPPKPEVRAAAAGRVIAALIALVPAYLLGLPLLATISVLGALAAATVFNVALMPLLPKASWLPKFVRVLPGSLLFLTGLFTVGGAAYFAFYGLPAGWLLASGAVSLLGGSGLRSLISKLRDPETKSWKVNDAWYIGGFASALFVAAGLGASLLGLGGPIFVAVKIAGLAGSPILLYHLPETFWAGVATAAKGLLNGPRSIYAVAGAWHEETKFQSNLGKWYRYWVNKSFWYAPAFIVPLALQGVAHAVEFAVSVGLGLTLGALRAPLMFLWGRAYKKNPNGRLARFLAGLAKTSFELMEGSKADTFDRHTKELKAAMDEGDPVTKRPTLKAAGAFVLLRFMQAAWLLPLAAIAAYALGFVLPFTLPAWVLGLRGIGLILGAAYGAASLFAGIRNAWGVKKPVEKDAQDPDDPKSLGTQRLFGWRW
jgi:hypothetical protein